MGHHKVLSLLFNLEDSETRVAKGIAQAQRTDLERQICNFS